MPSCNQNRPAPAMNLTTDPKAFTHPPAVCVAALAKKSRPTVERLSIGSALNVS
jgi:hypothetical protein